MKNILVTGAAGYIGSIVVRRLLEKGYRVVAYDSLINGHSSSIPNNIPFIQADIEDIHILKPTLEEYNIDAVMHFAGFLEIDESMKNPRKYFDNNVCKSIVFLNTIQDAGIKIFIFSSSAAVYGAPNNIPISERDICKPINVYGLTKRMFENILMSYSMATPLNFVSLRYFNAAGAAYGIGEAHNPESHLIPLVLQVAQGKRDNIRIFGSDYKTKDGTCMRDYVHVLDIADAHIAALEHLLYGGSSNIFNIGTGKATSVKEIINICKEVTGTEIPIVKTVRRPGDPDILVADVSKIKEVLNWEAKYNIKEIIESAWNWHNHS